MREKSDIEAKNKRTVSIVIAVVFIMVGLAYASVPLYRIFCSVTGWGGTTQVSTAFPKEDQIVDRVITVRFDANTAQDLPWSFEPEKRSIDVRIGEKGFINFKAANRSREAVGGTAVFNVTPLKAGKYFQKVQCFCFDEQILQPGQRVNMPVLFYVDPKMIQDRNMEDVSVITLSYSFFRSDDEDLSEKMGEFYETSAQKD